MERSSGTLGVGPHNASPGRDLEVQRENSRDKRLETRDQSESHKKCNERFVIKKEFNI